VKASETYVVSLPEEPEKTADSQEFSQPAPQTWKTSWRHPILFAKQVFHKSAPEPAE
jgi:hypothetical protein